MDPFIYFFFGGGRLLGPLNKSVPVRLWQQQPGNKEQCDMIVILVAVSSNFKFHGNDKSVRDADELSVDIVFYYFFQYMFCILFLQ